MFPFGRLPTNSVSKWMVLERWSLHINAEAYYMFETCRTVFGVDFTVTEEICYIHIKLLFRGSVDNGGGLIAEVLYTVSH